MTPLDDEVGDESRAERLAATAIRRFVRYLELMRARDGETTEELDVRVEIDAAGSDAAGADAAGAAASDASSSLEALLEADPPVARDLGIPDDPTVLSYLLSGIVQVELPRRQALLEAETTVERLEGLVALLEREVLLLSRRLRQFTPDTRLLGGVRRS